MPPAVAAFENLHVHPGLFLDSAAEGDDLAGKRIGAAVILGADRRIAGIISERDIVHVLVERGAGALDEVIVTAAPDLIPPSLINQLKAGGRMVVPVGLPEAQQLVVAEKDLNGRITTKEFMPVRFSLLEGAEELSSASLKQ